MDYTTHNFLISSQKWGGQQIIGSSGGLVTFSFATTTYADQFLNFDGIIDQTDFQKEIIDAFAAWELVADIKFQSVADAPNVDIRLGWANIDGRSGILGDATLPSSGPLESVIIRFDQQEDWFTGGDATLPKIDFSYVATHEIGHGIGLLHSDVASSLMADNYDEAILGLTVDDVAAATEMYGASNLEQLDVFRFFRPDTGGHLFTTADIERESLQNQASFREEGVGFEGLSITNTNIEFSTPVYRFFNKVLGSHFYTSNEDEKNVVLDFDVFQYEGISFRALTVDTAATEPVYRFFNLESGGHFYTIDENEKNVVMEIDNFRFEGVGFYAYPNFLEF